MMAGEIVSPIRKVGRAVSVSLVAIWVLITLYLVAGAGIQLHGAAEITTVRILGADTAAGMVGVPGLVYRGTSGIILVVVEFALVLLGFAFSISRHLVRRRLGFIVVVAWFALWAAGAVWMELLSAWNHPMSASAALLGLISSIMWMALDTRKGSRPQ
jgi:hypothetical protein